MFYTCNVLTPDEVRNCQEQYIDSKLKKIERGMPISKSNSIIDGQSSQYRKCIDIFQNAVRKNGEFNTVYLFKDISPPMFTQYNEGDLYKRHIDELLMNNMRTDHSITLFLNDPEDYDGGELRILLGDQHSDFKLQAGDAVIYPTGCLHEVLPVTRGKRQVALLWAQSAVDEPYLRSELINLGKNILSQVKKYEKNEDHLREFVYPLEQVKNNILRAYGNLQ